MTMNINKQQIKSFLIDHVYYGIHEAQTDLIMHLNDKYVHSEYVDAVCTHSAHLRGEYMLAMHGHKEMGQVMKESMENEQAWEALAQALKNDVKKVALGMDTLAGKLQGLANKMKNL